MIQLKRVYEKPSRKDGVRILVDRLWPRGLTKERAAVNLWLKDVAPSTELRKWFASRSGQMEGVPGPLSERTSREERSPQAVEGKKPRSHRYARLRRSAMSNTTRRVVLRKIVEGRKR